MTQNDQIPDQIELGSFLQDFSLSFFINGFLQIRYKKKLIDWQLFPRQWDFCQEIDRVGGIPEEWLWLLKNRQTGISHIFAAYIILKCQAHEGFRALVLSKTGDDAVSFVKNKIVFHLENLKKYAPEIPWYNYKATTEKVVFENGSYIDVFNCANHASRGENYEFVLLDEAGFGNFVYILEDVLQAVSGTIEHSEGNLAVVSTSAPGTPYNARSKLYFEEGAEEGISFYTLGFDTFPPRVNNPVWKAKQINKLGEVRFQQEYFEKAEDAFATREGYGFKQFERPRGRHVKKVKLNWKWQYWVVYDHGRTHDHPAMLWHMLYSPVYDHMHVFHEQYWPDTGLDTICHEMLYTQLQFRRDFNAPPPYRSLADTAITADDSSSEDRQTIRDIIFKKTKLYFTGSIKHNERLSTDWLVMRVNENKISIDPSCVHTIRQFKNILWAKENQARTRETERRGRYGVLVDKDNEAIDLGRYACAEINVRMPSKEEREEPLPAYSREAAEYRAQHQIHNLYGPKKSLSKDFLSM
jgi:hypothetical protein